MNRVFFDCGRKAMEKLSSDSSLLTGIAKRYSCSPQDLPSRLDAEAENISSLKGRISALAQYVSENEKTRILSEIGKSSSASYTYTTDVLSTDELLKLGFAVMKEAPGKLLIFMQPETKTCLLFSSGEAKCGAIVKETARSFGGRGGGRDDNARAIFSENRDMKAFAEAAAEMVK
jgi:alanyl-tRNA synthetase